MFLFSASLSYYICVFRFSLQDFYSLFTLPPLTLKLLQNNGWKTSKRKEASVYVKWPPKVRQYFEVKIVQAAERACCLWIAGGKPFSFALILRLL